MSFASTPAEAPKDCVLTPAEVPEDYVLVFVPAPVFLVLSRHLYFLFCSGMHKSQTKLAATNTAFMPEVKLVATNTAFMPEVTVTARSRCRLQGRSVVHYPVGGGLQRRTYPGHGFSRRGWVSWFGPPKLKSDSESASAVLPTA